MARLRVAGALVAATCWVPRAHADSPAGAVPPAEPAPAARPAETTSDQEAAELFHQAEARYGQGDVAGALELMQAAYARSGRPELLFNLGELRRELGDCATARNNYAEYLTRVPDGRRRDEASRSYRELDQRCPETREPAPPVQSSSVVPVLPAPVAAVPMATTPILHQTTAEPRVPYWTPATIAGWASLGAGAVATVTATVFAVQASHDQKKLEAHFQTGVPFTQNDKELESDGERSAAVARGLYVGAGALVAAGVTLLVLRPGDAKPSGSLAVGFDARSATASWRGSF
ncbi:MAG TPA: hypothetical protein VGQ57_06590 [Polyangiaceae bacterium]|nr:hypothetical protein [Polyangiaceae bacterium]